MKTPSDLTDYPNTLVTFKEEKLYKKNPTIFPLKSTSPIGPKPIYHAPTQWFLCVPLRLQPRGRLTGNRAFPLPQATIRTDYSSYTGRAGRSRWNVACTHDFIPGLRLTVPATSLARGQEKPSLACASCNLKKACKRLDLLPMPQEAYV